VPLAVSHPPAELAYVFQDAGLSLALTDEEAAAKVGEVASSNGAVSEVIERPAGSPAATAASTSAGTYAPAEQPQPAPGAASEAGALIIYTSGTTGKPKGVLHTHRSLAAQCTTLCGAWGWSQSDRILHTLPLHHVHGIVNAAYCPLSVGGCIDFMPKFSPSAVWARLMEGRTSVFMGVPTMYALLLSAYDAMAPDQQAAARRAAAGLRLTVSGSSACPVPIMKRWKELSGQYLLERYGMTEIGMALSNPYQGGERRPGSVGQPLPGVQVAVAPDGELLVKGPMLFTEYWGRAQATRDAFDGSGFFRTGDTVAVDAGTGCYAIQGRTSVDILKVGGYKVSALDVEGALLEHPGVAEVAVLGVPDEVYGQVITAVVAAKDPAAAAGLPDALRAHCATRLAPYQAPKRYHPVAAIPRNAMGKVNKVELLRALREGRLA